jgi:hypothetical protein
MTVKKTKRKAKTLKNGKYPKHWIPKGRYPKLWGRKPHKYGARNRISKVATKTPKSEKWKRKPRKGQYPKDEYHITMIDLGQPAADDIRRNWEMSQKELNPDIGKHLLIIPNFYKRKKTLKAGKRKKAR